MGRQGKSQSELGNAINPNFEPSDLHHLSAVQGWLERGNHPEASKDPEYLSRFAEDLQLCRDVEVLREDTMAKYESSPETTWLYGLVNLRDWFGTVACLLDESLECEHGEGHYKSPFSPS